MINCEKINLKRGSKAETVKTVQQYLQWLGLYKSSIDGEFGKLTEEAVKKLQKQYNLKQDGIFGQITCKNSGINGQDISNSNHIIEKDTFKDMIKRHDTFYTTNKRYPNIIYTETNQYRYITQQKYQDMKNRWDKFIKENNREPKFMNINVVKTYPEKTKTEDQKYIDLFSDAVGKKITSFQQGYEAIKNRGYILYYNDVYDMSTALNRLKNRKGINCCDISQLLYRLAKAFGLEVHYVHLMCKSGTGHIIIKVRKKGDSKWTWVDGAAALSSGKDYGSGWCYNGRVVCEDDRWLLSDDGKT